VNGFHLLQRHETGRFASAISNAEPYDYGSSKCLDVEVGDVDISLIFLKGMDVPSLAELKGIFNDLPLLDEQVSRLTRCRQHFETTGNEYELSYVEIESPEHLALFYCGVGVNAQWGVEFERDCEGKWEFSGFC
tara:strand:- start:10875 stop:11276 length:402 start_codon:yes stop_codon:yes gene_type:complete